ncbi:ABC transporter permease [Candidatus Uabimicrobium amorphum]|uniref:ABC transporter permease n=1 Tax=Uabimicrobium amorphum TaxID=2596890 RepID=A0A5S9IK18_UABAM|nr:ABC transporter permease [Candidatus Uabimicrobium amorphum]BBM83309.1 ABC transporter permease [Candidatus Uabimicrobium amorphum]
MGRKELDLWSASVLGALGILIFLGMWELLTRTNIIDMFFLPPPSQVVQRAWNMTVNDGVLLVDIRMSAMRVLIGFLLSVIVGIPIGLVMGMNPYIRAMINPIISIIRPLPALSWIPLSMLWLGIDEQQKYAIVFMGCFASIVVYTTDATLRVDPLLQRAARNLGASRLQVLLHVTLPGALPDILSGLKVVLAIAWTCVISAEMVGANSGLGFRIWTAKEWSDTSQVLVGMICISLTVLLLDILFRFIEKFLLPWQSKD